MQLFSRSYLSLTHYFNPLGVFDISILNPIIFFPTCRLCLLAHCIKTPCSLKFLDLGIYAVKILFLCLVYGRFYFILQSSVVLPTFFLLLTSYHFFRSSIFTDPVLFNPWFSRFSVEFHNQIIYSIQHTFIVNFRLHSNILIFTFDFRGFLLDYLAVSLFEHNSTNSILVFRFATLQFSPV